MVEAVGMFQPTNSHPTRPNKEKERKNKTEQNRTDQTRKRKKRKARQEAHTETEIERARSNTIASCDDSIAPLGWIGWSFAANR